MQSGRNLQNFSDEHAAPMSIYLILSSRCVVFSVLINVQISRPPQLFIHCNTVTITVNEHVYWTASLYIYKYWKHSYTGETKQH